MKNNKLAVGVVIFIIIILLILFLYNYNTKDNTSISNTGSKLVDEKIEQITWDVTDWADMPSINEDIIIKEDLESSIKSNCENSPNVQFCIDSEINTYLAYWPSNTCSNIVDKYKKRCEELQNVNKEVEKSKSEFKESLKDENKTSDQQYLEKAINTNDKSICDKIVDTWLKDFCKIF